MKMNFKDTHVFVGESFLFMTNNFTISVIVLSYVFHKFFKYALRCFTWCTSMKCCFFLKNHVKFGGMIKVLYSKYAPSLVIHFSHF